jgi:hypothetical protein
MNKSLLGSALIVLLLSLTCCQTEVKHSTEASVNTSWQQQFDEQLQLSGHRNWILVVDKAFPQQPGMHIINTNEKLLPVLESVLKKISASTHVKPIIYNDAELQFITDSLAPGAEAYKVQLEKVLNGAVAQPLLHDTVFVRMDKAAKLFSITVLKTEEVIPYSSVFLELDCAYWGGEKEKQLRELMKSSRNK